MSANEEDRRERSRFQSEVLNHSLGLYSTGRQEDAARMIIDYLEGSTGAHDSLLNETKETIRANSHATLEDLKQGLDGIRPAELEIMKTPVLLMKSSFGPKLVERVVDRLRELIPSSQLQEIGGSSHGTIVDSSDYSAAVLEFVRKN